MGPFLLRHPYPNWVLRLLPFGAAMLLLLVPLDRRASNILEATMAAVTALACLSTVALRSWRAVGVALAATLVGWVLAYSPALVEGSRIHKASPWLLGRVALLWMCLVWVALPCLVPLWIKIRRLGVWAALLRRWPDGMVAVALVHVLWCTVACAWAQFPKIAYTQLREDLYPFAILFVLVVRAGRILRVSPAAGRAVRYAVLPVMTLLPFLTILAISVVLVLYHAGWIRDYVLAHGWIVRENLGGEKYLERLLFPFTNPNRLGYFLLISGLGGLAAALMAGSRVLKAMSVAVILFCLVMTWVTLTRGALLAWAAAAGVGIFLAAPRHRWQIVAAMAVLAPVGFFLISKDSRQHLINTLQITRIKPGGESSINARFALWQLTLASIAERPVVGLGYGTDSFEATMARDVPAKVEELRGTSHAHNVLLEITVESGIPAGITLTMLVGLLCYGVATAYRLAPERHASTPVLVICLALLAGMIVYGMANYPLRRALGHHTVFLVGMVVALAETIQLKTRRALTTS